MKIDKYWKLRLKKWWITKVVYWTYRDLPFSIAYTSISKSYEYSSDFGKVLASFDVPQNNRHYVIYLKNE